MRNIKLVMEYDGTRYSGFQEQRGRDVPTIQRAIENAIQQTTGESLRIIGSGRTDAGVHALGQVANFFTESMIPAEKFAPAMNSRLPRDIAIIRAEEVDRKFHARFSALRKTYRYTWFTREIRSPFWQHYAYQVYGELDIQAMQEAADLFIGEHDFTAFKAAQTDVVNCVRCIYNSEITADGPLIHFTVEGNGFLRHMIRIMAGTLTEVGMGKREAKSIEHALNSRQRSDAGITAPAHGLTLLHVTYEMS